MMKRYIICSCLFLLVLAGCSNPKQEEVEATVTVQDENKEYFEMKLYIDDTEVPLSWEDNDSVKAIAEMIVEQPLTVEMSMYGGFEQVGDLGREIISDDKQLTTAAGDIVLYAGNNIVIFYGSNSWAYTRLGHIDLSADQLKDLLGNKDVSITIS